MHKMVLAALAATMLAGSANAATQVVSGGMLTSATGVIVGNLGVYDVGFFDTCSSAFGTCTTSSFNFSSAVDASTAAQSVLDQVLLDTKVGQFDSNPQLTIGCGANVACSIVIPYLTRNELSSNGVFFAAANNSNQENFDSLAVGSSTDTSLDRSIFNTFARFTRTGDVIAAVPEPATWSMMIVGMGAIGFSMRRRRNVSTTVKFA